MTRRSVLAAGAGAGALGAMALGAGEAAAAVTPHARYNQWMGSAWSQGSLYGVQVTPPGLQLVAGKLPFQRMFQGPGGVMKAYDYGAWRGPWVSTYFPATEIIGSWSAATPGPTWTELFVQVRDDRGVESKFYTLGRWTHLDPGLGGPFVRHSVSGQADTTAKVDVDTLVALTGRSFRQYRLHVNLCRPVGTSWTPTVAPVGAVASVGTTTPTYTSGAYALGRTLPVPVHSQELHAGHYPEWGAGGESWCSPTSTAMVVEYWKQALSATEQNWVPSTHVDRSIDATARLTYDAFYKACGNWSFNAAYATRRNLNAFVTRMRSLSEAERFIAAGIPLVVSTSFQSWQLPGAGYSTAGHLMVIVGFTSTGDVVVNDPASHMIASNSQVRTVYPRRNFEDAWARSGHTAYVIRPWSVALPPRPAEPNW